MSKSIFQVLFNRGFLTLFVCYSLACTCFAFVNVGLLLHATEDFGMAAVIVGSIIGLVSIIGLCMRPVSAILVDRLNRKRLLIFAFFLEALSTFGLAFASQYALMYALQITRGIAWGLISCAGGVLVADIVGRKDLGLAMGVYMLGMVIGSSIASAGVATIGDAIGFTATFLIGSILAAVAGVLAFTLPTIRHSEEPSEEGSSRSLSSVQRIIKDIKSIRIGDAISLRVLPITGISFTFQVCSTALGATFLVAFGRVDLGIANVGIAATIYNVIMYVSRPVYGRIMDRFGARWCIIPSFVGFIAANIIVWVSSDMTSLVIAAVLYGICSGGYTMAPRTMAMRRLGEGREAVASSTSGIGNDIGMALGSVLVPAIAAMFGGYYRNAYLAMGIIAAIGLLYCIIYTHVYLRNNPKNPMFW